MQSEIIANNKEHAKQIFQTAFIDDDVERTLTLYNLFRLAHGKIVEHWDVFEEIPTEWAHGNGKF